MILSFSWVRVISRKFFFRSSSGRICFIFVKNADWFCVRVRAPVFLALLSKPRVDTKCACLSHEAADTLRAFQGWLFIIPNPNSTAFLKKKKKCFICARRWKYLLNLVS